MYFVRDYSSFLEYLDCICVHLAFFSHDPEIFQQRIAASVAPMSYAESFYFMRKFLHFPWKKIPLIVGRDS